MYIHSNYWGGCRCGPFSNYWGGYSQIIAGIYPPLVSAPLVYTNRSARPFARIRRTAKKLLRKSLAQKKLIGRSCTYNKKPHIYTKQLLQFLRIKFCKRGWKEVSKLLGVAMCMLNVTSAWPEKIESIIGAGTDFFTYLRIFQKNLSSFLKKKLKNVHYV